MADFPDPAAGIVITTATLTWAVTRIGRAGSGSLGAVRAITYGETSCASEARRIPKPNRARDRPASVGDAAGKSTSAYRASIGIFPVMVIPQNA